MFKSIIRFVRRTIYDLKYDWEMKKVVVIDYEKKRSKGMRKYIRTCDIDGTEITCFRDEKGRDIKNIIFRNFSELHIEQNTLMFCTFENCGDIYMSNGIYASCEFRNIKSIILKDAMLQSCTFSGVDCNKSAFFTLYQGSIITSTLNNIKLRGNALLVIGHGYCRLSTCTLSNVTSERKDQRLFSGSETLYYDKTADKHIDAHWKQCELE